MTTTPPSAATTSASDASPVTTTPPDAPSPTGQRRRRPSRVSGEEREAAIVATLERLLATRAWRDVSVDDLARGAGISRPTFYFYFPSKEAVLLTLLEPLVAGVLSAQADAPALLADDPAAAWRQALGASYATWIANRDVIRAAADARGTSPEVRQLWADLVDDFVTRTAAVVEAERERGVAPDGLPARELAVCLNRMSEGLFESVLVDDEPPLPEDRVLDALVDVWLRGIYGQRPDAPSPRR